MVTREAEAEEEAGSMLALAEKVLQIDDYARFSVNLESRLAQVFVIVQIFQRLLFSNPTILVVSTVRRFVLLPMSHSLQIPRNVLNLIPKLEYVPKSDFWNRASFFGLSCLLLARAVGCEYFVCEACYVD